MMTVTAFISALAMALLTAYCSKWGVLSLLTEYPDLFKDMVPVFLAAAIFLMLDFGRQVALLRGKEGRKTAGATEEVAPNH